MHQALMDGEQDHRLVARGGKKSGDQDIGMMTARITTPRLARGHFLRW